MIVLLYRLEQEFRALLDQTAEIEDDMQSIVLSDDRGGRLMEMPGVGLITIACLLSWVGDAKHFRSGRDLAAWIGLVPKQSQDNLDRNW
jgi:transposase